MKNKVRYVSEILETACSGHNFAVDKRTGKVVSCPDFDCSDCVFNSELPCHGAKKKWAEAEFEEPITVERLDREFYKFCGATFCGKYLENPACAFEWLLKHYDVKEKTEK